MEGKSIVISGTFQQHSRDEMKELIERNGGKNVSGVSKSTSFLLAGEGIGPSKLEKAQSFGIQILSEEDFYAMIGLGAEKEPSENTSSKPEKPENDSQLSLF